MLLTVPNHFLGDSHRELECLIPILEVGRCSRQRVHLKNTCVPKSFHAKDCAIKLTGINGSGTPAHDVANP